MSERDQALREWAAGEERLYPVVTLRPDLYEACTALVRSLVDHLANVPDLDALVTTYRNGSFEAEATAAGVDQQISPEIERTLVRQSAYAMRAREIERSASEDDAVRAIERARRAGAGSAAIWAVGENELWPPYRRVEMSLSTGRAVVSSTELSAETMTPVFILGAARLDPASGRPADPEPLVPERTFTDPETWRAAREELLARLVHDAQEST